MLEENIDELYSIARKHLAALETRPSTLLLILLNEFLDAWRPSPTGAKTPPTS